MKLKNVTNVNTRIHGIILRETLKTSRGQQTDLERAQTRRPVNVIKT